MGNLIFLANLIGDFRWQLFKKAGHAVTDEYIDYIVLSIQAFLSDLGLDDLLTGQFPTQDWYWQSYSQGGNCLNPILNCDPFLGRPQPTESPQTNGESRSEMVPKFARIPPQIAVGGKGISSLKKAVQH